MRGRSVFGPKHKRIASLLRKIRLQEELRQIDLAERLRLPQSFVSRYENGERRLDFVEVAEICTALGVRFSDFVRRFEGSG